MAICLGDVWWFLDKRKNIGDFKTREVWKFLIFIKGLKNVYGNVQLGVFFYISNIIGVLNSWQVWRFFWQCAIMSYSNVKQISLYGLEILGGWRIFNFSERTRKSVWQFLLGRFGGFYISRNMGAMNSFQVGRFFSFHWASTKLYGNFLGGCLVVFYIKENI